MLNSVVYLALILPCRFAAREAAIKAFASCLHPSCGKATLLTHKINQGFMCRISALFIVERLRQEVTAAAVAHYQALALHKTRNRTLRKLIKRHDTKCPKNQARARCSYHIINLVWFFLDRQNCVQTVIAYIYNIPLSHLTREDFWCATSSAQHIEELPS